MKGKKLNSDQVIKIFFPFILLGHLWIQFGAIGRPKPWQPDQI